jgi:hypothetical protein
MCIIVPILTFSGQDSVTILGKRPQKFDDNDATALKMFLTMPGFRGKIFVPRKTD